MHLSSFHIRHLPPRLLHKKLHSCTSIAQPVQNHSAKCVAAHASSDDVNPSTNVPAPRIRTPRPASRIATDRPDKQRPEDNPDLDDLVLDDAYYEEMGISREDVMEQLAWDPADVDPESYDIGDRPGSSHRPGSRQLLQGDDANDVEVQQPMGNSSSWADDRFGGGMGGMTLEEMGELSDDMPMDLREHLLSAEVYGPPVSSCPLKPQTLNHQIEVLTALHSHPCSLL